MNIYRNIKDNTILIKKTLSILSKRRKIELILLLLIAPLTSFFDSVSLLIIGPFLSAISGSNNIDILLLNNIVNNLISLFGFSSLITISAIFIASVIIANILRIIQLYTNNIFAAAIESEISTKTFRSIITNEYQDLIQDSSSFNLTILLNHIGSYGNYIKSSIQLITSTFISLAIFFTLVFIDSKIFIISFITFFIVYICITFKYQNLIKDLTLTEIKLREKQIKITQESLSSIKDIILGNNYSTFINNYKKNDYPMRRIKSYLSYLISAPKYFIEIIALSSIGFIAIFSDNANTLNQSSLVAIGTLGLGAQRFLPLLQVIFSSWINVNASRIPSLVVLKIINKSTNKIKFSKSVKRLDFKKSIEFRDINYSYRRKNFNVIENMSLKITIGDFIGIVGETGAGKTTFIDLLIGLLRPTSGGIYIDNKLISNQKILNSWRDAISHVPQQTFLIDDSIAANIAFGVEKDKRDFRKIVRVSKIAQIYDFIFNLPEKFETKVGERGVNLSGGQSQRISIARALYENKNLLVLDESTNSLDSKTELKILKGIKNYKKDITILMITHKLENLRLCNRIIKIENGKILSDENFK